MGIDPGSSNDLDPDSDGQAQRLVLRRPFRWDGAGSLFRTTPNEGKS